MTTTGTDADRPGADERLPRTQLLRKPWLVGLRPTALAGWLVAPVPAGRVAAFRTLAYLYIPLELLQIHTWVLDHKDLPGALYKPLLVGRLLPLPVPTHDWVVGVHWTLVVAALAAATGRAPRLLGWTVAGLYFEWQVIAMSYGKVDHDRFAFVLALCVLATAGPARWGDPTPTERGGWALRMVQLGAIATYFLAALAKLRHGGLAWMWGATLTRAVLRRGTPLAEWMLDIPGLLVALQCFILVFELGSPVVFFVTERARHRMVGMLYAFHAGTYAAITIAFWPHLVALASFLPLERVRPVVALRALAARISPSRPRLAAATGSAGQSDPSGGEVSH